MKTYTPCAIFSKEDEDISALHWWPCRKGYARRRDGNKTIFAHRVIGARIYGKPLGPDNVVDHINHDKLDNRRENLRITTHAGNSQNRRCNPLRGTTWHKKVGKWQAAVNHLGKIYYCGLFACRSKAAEAAKQKRDELGFLSHENNQASMNVVGGGK